MDKSDITIGIVGAGGDGVVAAGEILANAAASEGLHCMMVKSFGPQIRGGESSCRLRISEREVLSPGNDLDVLVCFDWGDYKKFRDELGVEDNVIILMDEQVEIPDKELPITGGKDRTVLRVPFVKLAADIKNPKGKNMIMLGVLAGLFSFPKEQIKVSIKKRFGEKKQAIIDANIASLHAGEDFAKRNFKDFDIHFKYTPKKPHLMITGDEAVAFGALSAGCRFYSSYPITPASEIMEWLSVELPKFGGVVVQAEDEISAICMVTGAAYGGVKAMSATSGPGLSLKLEALGLGTMAELPYVVVDVQRGGPSTGLPTKSEQADLCQSIYGMHGDAPHAVMAAADVDDCFRATIEAFNVAEAYQMPVILLSDQFVGHRTETISRLDFESVKLASRLTPKKFSKDGYKRFEDTPDGISPMTWPGIKGGEYLCSGIEHDEWGAPSAEFSVHQNMSAKRHKKLEKLERDFKFIRRYGKDAPEVGLTGWGSNKGVVRETVEHFVSKGMSVGGLVPQLMYPLQRKMFQEFFGSMKALVVVENSFDGQFLHYLRGYLDMPPKVVHLHEAGGRFFTLRRVIEEVRKCLRSA